VSALTRSWAHDVNASYFAASTRKLKLMELLLERGADPTDALAQAVWSGAYDLAECALVHGAQIDGATGNSKPLLNDLIRWGQIPQMNWLLAHGASPNVADERGWTAVHQAASRGSERMLRAVLEAGGDIRRKDQQGQTPRDLARSEKLAALLSRKR